MSNTIIKVDNISKLYRLGEIGTGTLSHDLNRWWARLRGKEDPFVKIGELNNRTKKGNSDYVWSLKDISFDVKQGEVLGIIGRNGAGKSTLLKILSKVTTPTTGCIRLKGRIASLLEVGTGFHPELTGRENIFLNGAILGMTKQEIKSKFDEIVDFAGVERYIDTPVKRYSSGMYVRLAFAVAAFLEPEILVVDEVLAVGDAEFQKKCLGRMKDISKNEGRTVLFVSHNSAAIKELCDNCVLLLNGKVDFIGEVNEALEMYTSSNLSNVVADGQGVFDLRDHPNKFKRDVGIQGVKVYCNDKLSGDYVPGSDLMIEIEYFLDKKLHNPEIGIVIKDPDAYPLIGLNNSHIGKKVDLEINKVGNVSIKLKGINIYKPGKYTVNLYFGDNIYFYECIYDAFQFNVVLSDVYNSGCLMKPEWNKIWIKDLEFVL